jgi:lipopolysaccharide transport system permease protein
MPTKLDGIGTGVLTVTRPRPQKRTVSIHADSRAPILNVRELWAYREVLYALVRREIKVRYAQTMVGIGWAVLQPVLTTLVLTLLAGRWLRVPVHGVPYSVFALAGTIPWIYFTHVITRSSICLINNNGLLSKAYFPRLLLPIAAAAGGLVDLAVSIVILAVLMAFHRTAPGLDIFWLPVSLVFLTFVAVGTGVWIAVLNLYHRDVAHALPFATQMLFFMTPVAYSSGLVPHAWRLLYSLNPMTGVIEFFRRSLFRTPMELSPLQFAVSVTAAAVLLATGLYFFSRKEKTMADVGDA